MASKRLHMPFDEILGWSETAIYLVVGLFLFVAALEVIGSSAKLLWDNVWQQTLSTGAVHVLDELLLVLMIVEILHTVRLSIRAHALVTEPFLIVGLIASIRRVLVITLETADLTKAADWSATAAAIFHASMVELALLGLLILGLVACIVLLRRIAPIATPETTEPEKPHAQR
jgi:uncharacterized membrane protein (DUF373 family)